jgi:hypothetical protein
MVCALFIADLDANLVFLEKRDEFRPPETDRTSGEFDEGNSPFLNLGVQRSC